MPSRFELVAHPEHGSRHIRSVEVRWSEHDGFWMLNYAVKPACSLLLQDKGFERRDGLWRSTCFELFFKGGGGSAYNEFNFAPPGAWNAYSFTDWRKGMLNIEVREYPHLVDMRLDDRKPDYPERYELDVVLPADLVPRNFMRMSLAAVLEEKDGTKSYWALAHPPGKPNFHHPACFVAELPPPGPA